MLEFVAGLGMGMVCGAAVSLFVMIYLKGLGYGLDHSATPATVGKVDALIEDVAALKGDVARIDTRLDAVADTVVQMDLDRPKPHRPTGLVEDE